MRVSIGIIDRTALLLPGTGSGLCRKGNKKARQHLSCHARFRVCPICRMRPLTRPFAAFDHHRSSGSCNYEAEITSASVAQPSQVSPMTDSRHERQPQAHTVTGYAPDSHRIPSSRHLKQIHGSRCSIFYSCKLIIAHLTALVNSF